MNIPDTEMMEVIQAMKAQLRRDYLYMQIKNMPALYLTLEEINHSYHFSFPQGTFCVFVLGASSKVHGISIQYEWMLAAEHQNAIHNRKNEWTGKRKSMLFRPFLYH